MTQKQIIEPDDGHIGPKHVVQMNRVCEKLRTGKPRINIIQRVAELQFSRPLSQG